MDSQLKDLLDKRSEFVRQSLNKKLLPNEVLRLSKEIEKLDKKIKDIQNKSQAAKRKRGKK